MRKVEPGGKALLLVRVLRDGKLLFEGEIEPGQKQEVNGLTVELLWIRQHHEEPT